MTALSNRWVTDFGVPTFYAPVRIGKDIAPVWWWIAQALAATDLVHVGAVESDEPARLSLAALHRRPIVLSPHGSLMPWALHSGRGRTRKWRRCGFCDHCSSGSPAGMYRRRPRPTGIRALCSDGFFCADTDHLRRNGIWPDAIATADKPPRCAIRRIVVLGGFIRSSDWSWRSTRCGAAQDPSDCPAHSCWPDGRSGYRARLETAGGIARTCAGCFGRAFSTKRKRPSCCLLPRLCGCVRIWKAFGMVVLKRFSQGNASHRKPHRRHGRSLPASGSGAGECRSAGLLPNRQRALSQPEVCKSAEQLLPRLCSGRTTPGLP